MTHALVRHRLVVEAEAHSNFMLRLLEPFAVHDVQLTRIRMDAPEAKADPADPACLRAEIGFTAPVEVAERLWSRIDVMVAVRASHLVSTASSDMAA